MPVEKKAEHTPLPWKVVRFGSHLEVVGRVVSSVCEVAPFREATTAGVATPNEIAEGEANARLIVLSANYHERLVAALQRFVWTQRSNRHPDALLLMDAANAAASLLAEIEKEP